MSLFLLFFYLQGEEDNGEERRKLAHYVDCDTCDSMGCFDEEERRLEQEEEQDAMEWLQQYLECQRIEMEDENQRRLDQEGEQIEFFATFCCNSDGDGVRLCLYVDEQCSIKYSGDTAMNMLSQNDQATYYNAKTELNYALNYPVSCAGDIEYDELGQEEDENQEEEENQEEAEAAEWCQNLISNDGNQEEGAEVMGLSDCAYNGDQEEEEEQQEEEEADYGGYDYWYQIEYNDAQNFQKLCYQLQNLNGEGYWTTDEYDESTYDEDQTSNSSLNGLSTAAEVAIALIVLAVVAIIGFVAWKFCTKKKDADEKEFHLVDDKKGTLA